MSAIPQYAHYYMSAAEIDELKKQEIWAEYERVGLFNMPEVSREWFKKFFPDVFEKERLAYEYCSADEE